MKSDRRDKLGVNAGRGEGLNRLRQHILLGYKPDSVVRLDSRPMAAKFDCPTLNQNKDW